MKTKNVKIGKDIYTLTAVEADISGTICIELLGIVAPILTSFIDGNIELVNEEIRKSFNSQKIMKMLTELINKDILQKNGELVNDWKEDFQCQPLTLFKLGYEALRFNCEDFFTFISGSLKDKNIGMNLNEAIESLKNEGVELPPVFSLLFQSGNQKTEEVKES